MTQLKGRAGTRPTNSPHLPTHSKGKKQQGKGTRSVLNSTSLYYRLIPPRQSLCKGKLHIKRKHLFHQPFICVRDGWSSRRHPGCGGVNQGQVLKIMVKRAQPVCMR